MAIVKCNECGAKISDKAPACLKCGAPVPPGAYEAQTAKAKKNNIIAYSFMAIAGLVVMLSFTGPGKDQTAQGVSESHALMLCQTALKRASKDPDSADIPYVNSFGKGDEYYFAWGSSTRPVQMKNGFGMMVPAGASCIVSVSSGTIRKLTLDSETIL